MKYKKIISIALFAAALASLSIFLQKYSIHGNKLETIKINGNKFKAEVVDSSPKLSKGLGGRDGLCKKCGMLFKFSKKGHYSFWMEGMRFGLDIIWIDGDEIVYIAKNVSSGSSEIITPDVESDRVFEINEGLAEKLEIKIGDKMNF